MAAGDITIDAIIDIGQRERMVLGAVQLDGLNPTPVDLSRYLSIVSRAVVSRNTATTPTLGAAGVPSTVQSVVSAGVLNVYAFAPTLAGDATPIASTQAVDTVSFIAWGTVRA